MAAHAQNDRVEQFYHTTLNTVRTVLAHSGLSASFWAGATHHTAYMQYHPPCGPQHQVPADHWRSKMISGSYLDVLVVRPTIEINEELRSCPLNIGMTHAFR